MPQPLLLPVGLDAEGLAERLAPLGRLLAGESRARRITVLDSFDWLLHRAGWRLEAIEGRRPHLQLLPPGPGRPLATQAGPAPRFARELPPGPLRDLLLPVLEPRALLPVAVLELASTDLVLAPRRGARLRLTLEAALVGAPGEEPALPLRPVLLVPEGPRAAALRALAAAWPDCGPPPVDAVAAALEPLGRVPRDYTGKVRVPLEPGQPARDAARAVFLHLLGTLEANLPGLRADLDPEFLHDFRVAVRRTRSALGQLKGVFPPAAAARFAAGFARLQEVTGPARDLDVYVLELPALAALLPPRARPSLGPLARLLARRRRAEHACLVAALAEPWFPRLLASWRAFLDAPTPRRPAAAPNARRPAAAVAAARLRKLVRRALGEGAAITAASPADDLHELRKTCKKLRYLVELFAALLDREEAAAAVASLKGLQDTLGRHQDLQVQAAALAGYARELAREGKAPPPAYVAIGMLIERLRDEQGRARQEFAERFAAFADKAGRKRWKRLLDHAAARPAAQPVPAEARDAAASAADEASALDAEGDSAQRD